MRAEGTAFRRALLRAALLAGLVLPVAARAQPVPNSLDIADMTWIEVRDAVAGGHRTAIVPSGGIEQNGPHMILGKHDHIVRANALRIARELGDALVVPVLSYSPQGRFDPPEGNLRFPGTIHARFLPPIPPGLAKEEFMARLIGETEAACDRLLVEAAAAPNPPPLPPTALRRLAELRGADAA